MGIIIDADENQIPPSERRNRAFGIDSSGNYGYIKAGADTVTPFKSLPNMYKPIDYDVASGIPSVDMIFITPSNKTNYYVLPIINKCDKLFLIGLSGSKEIGIGDDIQNYYGNIKSLIDIFNVKRVFTINPSTNTAFAFISAKGQLPYNRVPCIIISSDGAEVYTC